MAKWIYEMMKKDGVFGQEQRWEAIR
jgi:hypothetical protein